MMAFGMSERKLSMIYLHAADAAGREIENFAEMRQRASLAKEKIIEK